MCTIFVRLLVNISFVPTDNTENKDTRGVCRATDIDYDFIYFIKIVSVRSPWIDCERSAKTQ
ncbi:uncharacterized protein Dvar_75820 [Desulfosarcina variabilis str. Montpellier]